jgi:hypothetical protein
MFEEVSYVERVLIVLNPDGTLKGAHQETLNEVRKDGAVIATQYLPAAPLDAEALKAILPDRAAAIAQAANLQDVVATLSQALADKNEG